MKLSVTTLGCPTWTLTEILERVKSYGYDGIELRGLGEHLDVTHAPEFANASAIAQTRLDFQNAGLEIVGIDASASFATNDPAAREKHFDEARRQIDLAAALEAHFVRVFGGGTPEGDTRANAEDRLVAALRELGDYCKANAPGVSVLLESHDAFSKGAEVATVVKRVAHPNVASLWDLHHPYRQGESAEETYKHLRGTIKLTHVKDSRNGQYCPLGDGDIPVRDMVALLKRDNWDGYLSVEWEKRWVPTLLEPEVAFPQYARKLQEYLAG